MVGSGPVPRPDLSICIPSYNRRQLVVSLVAALLESSGSFEIRVHDDGSSDGSADALLSIDDPRLHVSRGENRGRADALASAISEARGKFTMLFDDDDQLYPEGLARVLEDCAQPLPSGVAGYVYHLSDDGGRLGDDFGISRSNFLKLRNDLRIRGDKKEVVRTDLLKPIVLRSRGLGRRVPTSLYWTMIALDHDVICRNIEIGRKHYEKGGMSDRIKRLKSANPRPLIKLYRTHVSGFRKGRFRSPVSAARAVLALAYHYSNMLTARVLRRS